MGILDFSNLPRFVALLLLAAAALALPFLLVITWLIARKGFHATVSTALLITGVEGLALGFFLAYWIHHLLQ